MSTVDDVNAALTAAPRSLEQARQRDGLPREPGLYAWWTVRGSIPAVPYRAHPEIAGLDLFYIGISPSRATSTASLRSRVTGNHMRGNTGGSTFRLTLASLLFEEMGWDPVMSDRPLLTREENRALSAWQDEHLRLTWAVCQEPWTIEHEVIRRLQPPLNLMGNRSHPFAVTVSAARRRFKEAAEKTGPPTPSRSSARIRQQRPRGGTVGRVTLHEEIAAILRENGGWMTTQKVADAVSERGKYSKRDGSAMDAFQIHGRTKNYPDLFERDGSKVRLRG